MCNIFFIIYLFSVAVVVAFFLCWAPFHAQRIMAVYGKVSGTKSVIFRDIYMVLMYISGVLYFLSTCINPLLYNIMSHKFRDAFKVGKFYFKLDYKFLPYININIYIVIVLLYVLFTLIYIIYSSCILSLYLTIVMHSLVI